MTGLFCQPDTFGINCRYAAVQGKCHAQGLREVCHGIGRKHAGAGTCARASVAFKRTQVAFADTPALQSPHGLEHLVQPDVTSMNLSRQHGAAGDKYGRNVKPGCPDQHSRNYFIAGSHENQPIKGMGHGHDFNGICNQFPAGKRILHAVMIHGDTVTDTNCVEDNRRTSRRIDTRLHRI